MLRKGKAGDLNAELMEIIGLIFLLEVADMQRGNWKDLPQGKGWFLVNQYQN